MALVAMHSIGLSMKFWVEWGSNFPRIVYTSVFEFEW